MAVGIDLTVVWAFIIAFAVFAYVVMDGFDLGIGILFPTFEAGPERDRAMNSIAPVWDGNETWLVLGGGGLFAAFPLSYAVILPATYPLIIAMLAVPILIQVYFNSGLAYLLNRATGEAHCIAGPSALIGASNFFELAVAAAISIFGFSSGAALATVVGVLIEVPVMLSVVKIVNASKGWYERGQGVSRGGGSRL